jgi:hypothetical protein
MPKVLRPIKRTSWDIVITFVENPAAHFPEAIFCPLHLVYMTSHQTSHLGEMESTLSFSNGGVDLCSHHLNIAVVWELEIVDTGHDGRQVIV